MKTKNVKWNLIEDSVEFFKKAQNHKVCSVSETNHGHCISWAGDLDNDFYFSIFLIDGVLTMGYSDREYTLNNINNVKAIAYMSDMKAIINDKDDVNRLMRILDARTSFIPNMIKKAKFEDIMELFIWEYVSDKVEIYDNIIP